MTRLGAKVEAELNDRKEESTKVEAEDNDDDADGLENNLPSLKPNRFVGKAAAYILYMLRESSWTLSSPSFSLLALVGLGFRHSCCMH